ncbi:MAG: LuxR family transcriptional regulator [Bacteroidales bacterium]|nr:LuxR family transcriptional regulator [Bacteroidales bacterium]
MRKCLLHIGLTITVSALMSAVAGAYNDHRGHNLDSLERVVAKWTPDAIDRASTGELIDLNNACRDLMLGYNPINGEKSVFYARKALSISRPRGWMASNADAYRYIGLQFYGHEEYDSAMVYYKAALTCVDSMANGAVSPTDTVGYPQHVIDDHYSALYGSIGNLYNMMDSIPQAMHYYEKASELFEKNGWNESNSILWYNIGETWIDEGDMRKAKAAYDKAMEYAEASGDSLMIVDVWKGYGRLYMEEGKTWKSLPYLRKADAYYAAHPNHAPIFRTENLDYMQTVLSRQKLQLGRLAGALAGLILLAVGIFVGRRRKKAVAGTSQDVPAPSGAPQNIPGLSAREMEILDLIAKGYTAPQIAEALSLSTETIRWYRKKLIEKFDVSNTASLVYAAKEYGLI